MIPSKPPSRANLPWAHTSRTMLVASSSLCGYNRHEIEPAANAAVVVMTVSPRTAAAASHSQRGVAATAHDKRLAGDVASLVATQERRRRSDVGDRIAEAAQRHQAGDPPEQCVVERDRPLE